MLEEFTFPRGGAAHGIVGVKYWVQRRTTEENVNFHYDKDEGLASDQQVMRPPPLVGVTHLENWGAPTLVLNQTTIHNGNVDAPNIKPLTFQTDEAAYLAGYAAASTTATGTVATFGGMAFPSVTIFMDGFLAGANAYNTDNGTSVSVL